MKGLILALWGFFCLFSHSSYGFDYFDKDIDYWNEKKSEAPPTVSKNPPVSLPKEIPKKDKKATEGFSWKKALDPKKKEFWKEGNHVPPDAFIEVANNPSDKNIKNWFKLIETKNKLSMRLNKKIAEYVRKNGSKLKPKEKEVFQGLVGPPPFKEVDIKRYKLRMYFESSCPHCHRMLGTLAELRNKGFYVELKQIDKKRLSKGIPFPITPVKPGELQKMKITAWPVLFIADLKKKVLLRLDGYKSTSEVITHIKSQN